MLFAVTMDVAIPPAMDPGEKATLIDRERSYSRELQASGEWLHIWRRVGRYSNLSIFDVSGNERLHQILWNLPLFPYMTIEITPLATHPSDIRVA
ncbi:muconolactone Delta-isomerase family protein [Microtetraspora sp. NBRC 16547]|uniref:Muconolactone Delta-isomerase n=1 Tax=Microtetraspora glauca TaxID=1996 RepID=A0ABV3GTD0_MICGL|nr:muconolactone Delta-isomerase family protein [Microtetraspora sp. NBRC 16547]GLX02636.1 muconolactone Delta-isomerase [Microtetraspora sp. NBRC 16547]